MNIGDPMKCPWQPLILFYQRYPMWAGILISLLVISVITVMPDFLEDTDNNVIDSLGRTPLTLAAENGDDSTVRELLDTGLAVDAADGCRWTALMKAAAHGHLDLLTELIARGASLEHRDQAGYTALMVAVVNNRPEVVERLLASGARMDVADYDSGWTALTWAAKDGRTTLVRHLIEYGADVDHRATDATTPLSWARENNHEEVVDMLLSAGARDPAAQ